MAEEERNIAVQRIQRFFRYEHLPPELKEISALCAELAQKIIELIPDDPELTVGLRKLLEAKDCFVRARLMYAREKKSPDKT